MEKYKLNVNGLNDSRFKALGDIEKLYDSTDYVEIMTEQNKVLRIKPCENKFLFEKVFVPDQTFEEIIKEFTEDYKSSIKDPEFIKKHGYEAFCRLEGRIQELEMFLPRIKEWGFNVVKIKD